MTFPNSEHLVHPMTVEAASRYARGIQRFVQGEVRGPDPDELDGAFQRFEQRYGIGRWTIEHLRKGRAKTCDIGVFARLKAAYLDLCERQVSRLQHVIALEKATGDDTLEDLEAEAAALAARIAERKARMR